MALGALAVAAHLSHLVQALALVLLVLAVTRSVRLTLRAALPAGLAAAGRGTRSVQRLDELHAAA